MAVVKKRESMRPKETIEAELRGARAAVNDATKVVVQLERELGEASAEMQLRKKVIGIAERIMASGEKDLLITSWRADRCEASFTTKDGLVATITIHRDEKERGYVPSDRDRY